jgi:hypothetical protein
VGSDSSGSGALSSERAGSSERQAERVDISTAPREAVESTRGADTMCSGPAPGTSSSMDTSGSAAGAVADEVAELRIAPQFVPRAVAVRRQRKI